MTPEEKIQQDIKEAMKAREPSRVGTLRLLLTAIKNERIRAGEAVGEDGFTALVRKAVKQRRDAAEQFRQGGREELAAKEEAEIEVLSAYMPAQASESDIRAAVEELVSTEGLSGPQSMGKVMKAMLERFGSSADGGTISRIAREVLTR